MPFWNGFLDDLLTGHAAVDKLTIKSNKSYHSVLFNDGRVVRGTLIDNVVNQRVV